MPVRVGRTTLLVRDQDEAARFYRDAFGFQLLHDEVLPNGFRAMHIGPPEQSPVGLWLMPGADDRVGRQTEGEPFLILYTDDLASDLERLAAIRVHPARGGPIHDPERGESYAHIADLYGNEILLVQLHP
jgi:catechol 2,3-dioxygenase-like lactoylglutathione lyase family enzyme